MALPAVRNGLSLQTQDVRSYAHIPQVLDVPNLIQSQIQSYDWFNEQGLEDVFREVSPILDYTSKKYELHFQEHEFRPPKYSPQECKEREITFSQPSLCQNSPHYEGNGGDQGAGNIHGGLPHDDR